MKIGIFSDSHGKTGMIDAMLNHPEAAGVELWFFAGDVALDADYLAMVTDTPIVKVAGNNDWPAGNLPWASLTEAGGHKILLTHGDRLGVQYTTDELEKTARDAGADIAIYGHTHVADIMLGEITILNPGSIALPRDDDQGSFMVAELKENALPNVKLLRI